MSLSSTSSTGGLSGAVISVLEPLLTRLDQKLGEVWAAWLRLLVFFSFKSSREGVCGADCSWPGVFSETLLKASSSVTKFEVCASSSSLLKHLCSVLASLRGPHLPQISYCTQNPGTGVCYDARWSILRLEMLEQAVTYGCEITSNTRPRSFSRCIPLNVSDAFSNALVAITMRGISVRLACWP